MNNIIMNNNITTFNNNFNYSLTLDLIQQFKNKKNAELVVKFICINFYKLIQELLYLSEELVIEFLVAYKEYYKEEIIKEEWFKTIFPEPLDPINENEIIIKYIYNLYVGLVGRLKIFSKVDKGSCEIDQRSAFHPYNMYWYSDPKNFTICYRIYMSTNYNHKLKKFKKKFKDPYRYKIEEGKFVLLNMDYQNIEEDDHELGEVLTRYTLINKEWKNNYTIFSISNEKWEENLTEKEKLKIQELGEEEKSFWYSHVPMESSNHNWFIKYLDLNLENYKKNLANKKYEYDKEIGELIKKLLLLGYKPNKLSQEYKPSKNPKTEEENYLEQIIKKTLSVKKESMLIYELEELKKKTEEKRIKLLKNFKSMKKEDMKNINLLIELLGNDQEIFEYKDYLLFGKGRVEPSVFNVKLLFSESWLKEDLDNFKYLIPEDKEYLEKEFKTRYKEYYKEMVEYYEELKKKISEDETKESEEEKYIREEYFEEMEKYYNKIAYNGSEEERLIRTKYYEELETKGSDVVWNNIRLEEIEKYYKKKQERFIPYEESITLEKFIEDRIKNREEEVDKN